MISHGIGERLRSAREARGLSLEEIEAGTRIRRQYLRALEAEAFDEIPGPAYVKGFLRTYATYLGLSSDDLAALAPEISSATVIPGTILPPGSAIEVRIMPVPRRSRIRRIIAGVAGLLALGVAVFGYLLYGQLRQFAVTSSGARPPISAPARPGASENPRATPGAAVRPSPGPAVTEPPRSPGPASPPKTVVTAPLPAGRSSASPDAAPAPAVPPASPRVSSPSSPPTTPSSSPTPAPSGAPPAGSPAPAAPVSPGGSLVFPGPLHVVVVATDRTWVKVVADGATVFEGFMSAGTRQDWEARRELSLKAGNAGGLDVSVNGRSLGRLGNPGDAVDKTFTAVGTVSP
jgi:cytoskeleton protein RodZ